MARISFDGFKDPARRPRFIVWTVVFVIVIVTVMVPVLGITSTRWFCANGCHKVQDDTIESYRRSSHSNISCMACHMPVNANPIIFLMHKAEALGELAQTVTNNYELPLNPDDEVALTMKAEQCTQCHNEQIRRVTPSPGIKINHEVHAEKDIACPICHNRVAHNEDFDLTLKNPKTGEPNKKHANFMQMTACFRCHSQQPATGAPTGACSACHTPDFQLQPASHLGAGWYPAGHAKAAKLEEARVLAAGGKAFLNSTETSVQVNTAEKTNGTKSEGGIGPLLPKVSTINVCSTCHQRSFCTDCHKLPMPHPKNFQQQHGTLGKAEPQVCANCHGNAATFCDECHHGTSIQYKIDPNIPWRQQHPTAVQVVGAAACFKCHDPTYCAYCHVNGVPPKL